MQIDTVLMKSGAVDRVVKSFTKTDSAGHMRFYMDPNLSSFWLIFRHKGQSDSVWLTFRSTPAFISEACGYYNRYSNLNASLGGASRFTSVMVANPVIDTAYSPHVKIFL